MRARGWTDKLGQKWNRWSRGRTNREYTEINVISRYTVDPEPVENHGKYTVTVHYRLLGSYNLDIGYVREAPNSVQDVNYVVTGTNGEWRISDVRQ